MLRSLNGVIDYTLEATDGSIGKIKDFLFDDESWAVRYAVADTSKWLPGRQVLISPAAFSGRPDWESKTFPLLLSKAVIKDSPGIEEDKPVSRQKEDKLIAYYGWPSYRRTIAPEPLDIPPIPLPVDDAKKSQEADSHLRSAREIMNYSISASDGTFGSMDDFIMDDSLWGIRFLVINTNSSLNKKNVLVSPSWVKSVSWNERQVKMNITRKKIQDSPEYDPYKPVNQAYEKKIYDYYGRPKD